MKEYDIPLIIRGEVIYDHMVSFDVRRGGISFRTPDMKRFIDQFVLHEPVEMEDLYRLTVSDIIDFLEELGPRLAPSKNEHIRKAMEINLKANVQSEAILRNLYESLSGSCNRALLQEAIDGNIGMEYLEGWVRHKLSDREVLIRAFGARTVSLNPGNSPAAALYGMMNGALLRCDNIVKFPSNDPFTATAVALTMIEMAPDHPVTKHYSVGYWKGGDREVEEKLYTPRNVEKILAWGGYSSMRQVRAYLVPGLDLIALDPKVSCAMIGREAFTSDETMDYVAKQVAKDMGLFNQGGCMSARVLYVESGTDTAGIERVNRLGEMIYAEVQNLPAQLSSVHPDFPVSLRQKIDDVRHDKNYGVIGVQDAEGGLVVSKQNKPVDFKDDLNGRVANLVPLNRIEDALQFVTTDTQTIGIYPESLKDVLRDRCALRGAQRLTTLGCAVYEGSGYPHDAIELFRRMVRWIVVENFDRETVERGAGFLHQA